MGAFGRQLPRIVEATAAAMYDVANRIGNRSGELVPVDTGTLKASKRVLPPEITPDGVRVVVGYGYGEEDNPKSGEPAIGYAIPVHERTDVHHQVGQAKFLEQAVQEHMHELGPEIRTSIQRASRLPTGELVFGLETLGGE